MKVDTDAIKITSKTNEPAVLHFYKKTAGALLKIIRGIKLKNDRLK